MQTITYLIDIFDVLTSAVEVSRAAAAGVGLAAGTGTGGNDAADGVAVAAAGTTCEGGFFCGLMLPTVR